MSDFTAHRFSVSFQGFEWPTMIVAAPRPTPLPPAQPQDVFTGTSGNDTFLGTEGDDVFDLQAGGKDQANGKGGADVFNLGGAFRGDDKLNGGAGSDTLNIAGGIAINCGPKTIVSIETMVLGDATFDIEMDDANVTGNVMTIDASALTAVRDFTFDGSAETLSGYHLICGAADAILTTGAGADVFTFGANFRATDKIDGGINGITGDLLELAGDYASNPLVFQSDTIRNIESISLATGFSYTLVLDNANVVFGTLLIDGSDLGVGNILRFDGSDESSSRLTIISGAGNDNIIGGGADDVVICGTGNDFVNGGTGSDAIHLDNGLSTLDRIDGGAGLDTVFLDGNYTSGVTLNALTLRDIEAIFFGPLHSYNLTLDNLNVAPGGLLTLDGHVLGATDVLTIDADAVMDGIVRILGGDAADVVRIAGGSGAIVKGNDGNDNITVVGVIDAGERIDGGAGSDSVILASEHDDHTVLGANTLKNIESIELIAANNYDMVLADGNVAAGQVLAVNGGTLGANDDLIFDGSAETNGAFVVTAGAGDDWIAVGDGNDVVDASGGINFIDASQGGDDTFNVSGSTTVFFGAEFDGGDTFFINGTPSLHLLLDGTYLLAAAHTLPNGPLVRADLAPGHNYELQTDVTTATDDVGADGHHLDAADSLTFSSFGVGFCSVAGGAGDDVLTGNGTVVDRFTGNAGDDVIKGGGNADILAGGKDKDTFVYAAASDSTSVNYDEITAANFSEDLFDVTVTITGIDAAVNTGQLSDTSPGTFDGHMTAAMSGHLLAHHAILFTPDSGTLAGEKFLVIDLNNVAGYQTGADLVIDVTGSTGSLGTSDFI